MASYAADEDLSNTPKNGSGKTSPNTVGSNRPGSPKSPGSPASPAQRSSWQMHHSRADQRDGCESEAVPTSPKKYAIKTSSSDMNLGSPNSDGALDTVELWHELHSPVQVAVKSRKRPVHSYSPCSPLLRRTSSWSSAEAAQQRRESAFLAKLTQSEQRADEVVKRCTFVLNDLRSKREHSVPVRPLRSQVLHQAVDRLAMRKQSLTCESVAMEMKPSRREGIQNCGDARAAPLSTAARALQRRLREVSQT